MENILDVIEREFIMRQKDNELSIKDAALAVKNKEIEEKNNTIKQLKEKLQLFQSQYQDYKATCTKIIDNQRAENLELQEKLDILRNLSRVDYDAIMELCDKLKVKDDKIEELSTKLAEVVVGNKKHDDEVAYWKDVIDRKNDYMDELHEQIEDLESIIEGQRENIADLENEVKKLKDRLSSTSDKAGPYKMPDYEGFRKFADEVQRKKMEELKERDNEKINNINRKLSIPAFKLPDDYAIGLVI
jgi:chromosome segregation ATPase